MKAIIIEDEKPAARKLQRMLEKFPEIEVVTVISSVEEGISFFEKQSHPDLIFSDIVLGDGLSFDIFEKMPTQSFIIYTTAFDDYTLKAFKLNSIDYLLKPFSEEELQKAIEKVQLFLPTENLSQSVNFKTIFENKTPQLTRIIAKIGNRLKIVNVEDVCCFFTENKIVYAQTEERNYPIEFTLEELENALQPQSFFRINRQTIININFIKSIHTSPLYKVELTVSFPSELTISRERVKNFKLWLEGGLG